MQVKPLVEAVLAALGVAVLSASACADPTVEAVEFVGMAAPATVDEKTDVYTRARVIYRYTDGKTKTYDLAYHQIMATTEVINGNMVGGLFDQKEAPLIDNNGQMASDAADGTSLLGIPGIRAADTARNHPLALVIQFEFKELPPTDGVSSGSFWSKLPVTPGLAKLDQDNRTGTLRVVDYSPISFRAVNGGWSHCGATTSAWNTHLGSEELRAGRQDARGPAPSPRFRRHHRHRELQQALLRQCCHGQRLPLRRAARDQRGQGRQGQSGQALCPGPLCPRDGRAGRRPPHRHRRRRRQEHRPVHVRRRRGKGSLGRNAVRCEGHSDRRRQQLQNPSVAVGTMRCASSQFAISASWGASVGRSQAPRST